MSTRSNIAIQLPEDKDGNKKLMGRKRHSDKEIIPIKRKQSPYKKVGHGKTKQVIVFKNSK